MTFEEWWDSKIEIGTPDTFRGWEESCRRAWKEGAKVEREECAKACSDLAKQYAVYRDHWPSRNAANECARLISERSNVELTGAVRLYRAASSD
jgi:hypothetical protein